MLRSPDKCTWKLVVGLLAAGRGAQTSWEWVKTRKT